MPGRDNVVEMIFRAINESGSVVSQVIQEQQKIGQAAVQSNQQVRASLAQVTPEFDRLRDQIQGIGESWSATGTIGRSSLTALALGIKQIEAANGGAIRTAQVLEGAERKIYDSAKASLKDAIKYQREFNDEQQKVARATHDWTGLQSSIQGLGGTLGKVAIGVGGVFAAFSEGWRIGRNIDEWLKGNVEWWRKLNEQSTATLRSMGAEIVNLEGLTKHTQDLVPQILKNLRGRGGIGAASGLKVMEDIQAEIGKGYWDRTHEREDKAKAAAEKASNAASAAAKQYADDLGRLTGAGERAERQQRLVGQATQYAADHFGDSRIHVDALGKALQDLGVDVAEITQGYIAFGGVVNMTKLALPTTGPGAVLGAEAAGIGLAEQQAERQRQDEQRRQDDKKARAEADKREADARRLSIQEAAQRLAESAKQWGQVITDVFADLALTGGKNFGDIAGAAFQDSVRSGAGIFVKLLTSGIASIFGAKGQVKEENGRFIINQGTPQEQSFGSMAEAVNATTTGQRVTGAIGGTLAGVSSLLASGQRGTQRQSALSMIGSETALGASIGFTFGQVYGAVIGAIVGVVKGSLQALLAPPQGADYSYGRFGVRAGGQAFFESSPKGGSGATGQVQNISANAQRAAQAQVQAAFDSTYHDFVRTLLRFPLEVLPKTFAQIGDILPQLGKDVGGDIGRAASALFWRDFELWFKEGMPRDVAEHFRPVFAEAFTGMGFTLTRFNDIWAQLQDMEPDVARRILDALVEATVGMREAFDYLGKPFEGSGGLLDTAQREIGKTPADRLNDSFEPIYRLVDTLADAPLSEQITGWNEVNRLTQEVQQNVKDFMAEIASGIRAVTESFGASIRDLEIAGIKTATGSPDYQGQAEYLRNYANDLRARIGAATSPQEAQALGEELKSTIGQIYSLGQQLGPVAGEEFRKWALDALKEGRDVVIDRLKDLGQAVADENKAFLEKLRGPWEIFTGQATSAGDALNNLTDAINHVIGAVKGTLPDQGGTGPPDSPAAGGARRGGVPIRLRDPSLPEEPWYTPPDSGPPLFGPGSGKTTPGFVGRPVGAFDEVGQIGEQIGASLVAAISRSSALEAIAEAGRALSDLSKVPMPPPIVPVTAPKQEPVVLPRPPVVPVFETSKAPADDPLALIRGWADAIAASVARTDEFLKRAAVVVAPQPQPPPVIGRGRLSDADGGSTFAGALLSRIDKLERAVIETGARSAQILFGAAQGTTQAVLSSKGDITIPITIEGGGGATASGAGPSTRRGR